MSASRFTDTHVLYHVTSGQCDLAGRASPSTWDLPLGSQTPSDHKHLGAEPLISRQWQRKRSPSISLPHALSAEPFYLWTILGRRSRVLPFTSAFRFTDTCAGVEPFQLRINSLQRKQSPSMLHLPLGSQTLWCWTFFTFGQYMAEEAESFHVSICQMSTRHQFSWQANSEEAESFQIKHTTIRIEPICSTCRTNVAYHRVTYRHVLILEATEIPHTYMW